MYPFNWVIRNQQKGFDTGEQDFYLPTLNNIFIRTKSFHSMTKAIWLLLFLPLFSLGQKNGIAFQQASWSQLLAKAKTEKKIIFLDAYATWCGPCKKMASDVFTKEEVGNFFNRNFINAKIDMEAGEGLTIASRYKVEAYPTFLFINGDGKLLHKAVGYKDAESFVGTGLSALDPSKQFFTLKDKFKSGKLNTDQHYDLAVNAVEIEDDNKEEIVNSYFKRQQDWLTEKNINLLLLVTIDPASEYFKFLSKNEKAAIGMAGEENVTNGLDMIVYRFFVDDIDENASITESVAEVERFMKKHRPAANARKISYLHGITIASNESDMKNWRLYYARFYEEFEGNFTWEELNSLAWSFFEEENDPKLLRTALTMGLHSVRIESNFYNNDTVANLYYKLGKKKEAIPYAETAIKLGNAAGEDVTATEILLKKLK